MSGCAFPGCGLREDADWHSDCGEFGPDHHGVLFCHAYVAPAPQPTDCPCGDTGRPGHPLGHCNSKPSPATPDAPVCAECGAAGKPDDVMSFGICHPCLDRLFKQPAAPKLGAGDAPGEDFNPFPTGDDTPARRASAISWLRSESAILADKVKQLRASNAALTTEVAALRERLETSGRLLDGCVGMLLRARAILHVRKIAVTDWKKKVAGLLAEWESTKGGS